MMKSLATGDAAATARNAAAAAARRSRPRRAMIAELVRLCGECAVQRGKQAAHGVTVESAGCFTRMND